MSERGGSPVSPGNGACGAGASPDTPVTVGFGDDGESDIAAMRFAATIGGALPVRGAPANLADPTPSAPKTGGAEPATFAPAPNDNQPGSGGSGPILIGFDDPGPVAGHAPTEASGAVATGPAQTGPAAAGGGLIVNLVYDSATLATAPQSFFAGMNTAVSELEAAIHDAITVNVAVGYGEFGGQRISSNISEGDIGYTGNFTEGVGVDLGYASLRADLAGHETSAADASSVNALPVGSSLQGQPAFTIATAQAKALGLISPTATAIDGQIGMGTGFTGTVLVAGALHEITHAMGRIAGLSLDLFRYSSPGQHYFGPQIPAAAAYFSIDGGSTDLADFGRNSDPGDLLNPPASNRTPNDPFNEIIGNISTLTPVDLTIMDVLGFNVSATPADTTPPALVHDNPLTVAAGQTATITESLLQFDDNVSSHGQETYNVSAAPTHGSLLKSGTATSRFTQADIDNGLIGYHETGTNFSTDSFSFTVTDAVGNATAAQLFQVRAAVLPTVTAQNVGVVRNMAIPAGSLIASIANPSGDSITQYEFEDIGSGGGYFTVNGVIQAANQAFSVSASNLGAVRYVGGVTPGAETLDVGVYDATIGSYTSLVPSTAVTRPPASDFNGDGDSDILLATAGGALTDLTMNGATATADAAVTLQGSPILLGSGSVAGIGDFDGDGKMDILTATLAGTLTELTMNGSQASARTALTAQGSAVTLGSAIVNGIGDFNGDGKSDILLRNANGTFTEWTMNGAQVAAASAITYQGNVVALDASWQIDGIGDFNGDGKADVLLRNTNGTFADWTMNGAQISASSLVTYQGSVVALDASWQIDGIGDFNGDGKADVLLRNTNATLADWTMSGAQIAASELLTYQSNAVALGSSTSIAGVGDFNGDGKADILTNGPDGTLTDWTMNAAQVAASAAITFQGTALSIDPPLVFPHGPTVAV